MFRSSIRTKILTIAVGLIVLMVITAVLSLTLITQVGRRLEQLTNSYIPAYGDLARANIRSLEIAVWSSLRLRCRPIRRAFRLTATYSMRRGRKPCVKANLRAP